jgi:hypothetical protein
MHCSLAATGFVWFSRCVVFFVEDADLTQALEKILPKSVAQIWLGKPVCTLALLHH